MFLDLPTHTKLRAIVSRAFTSRAITALVPRVEALSAELLDAVRGRDEIDLVRDYAGPLPVRVIAELLGIPDEDHATFAAWSQAIVNLSMIDARRRAPTDDLLTRLVEGDVDGFRATPELLVPAIEEVVRFRSPAQIMFRQTTRAVELHGQTIPASRFVLLMLGSANRDPACFPNAHRFDVTRSPNPHIAFGHGIHACLGAALARAEARVALPDLL